jgi:predicted RNA-binding Zn-ribbon protein involved in translation (DUF1610 family)
MYSAVMFKILRKRQREIAELRAEIKKTQKYMDYVAGEIGKNLERFNVSMEKTNYAQMVPCPKCETLYWPVIKTGMALTQQYKGYCPNCGYRP